MLYLQNSLAPIGVPLPSAQSKWIDVFPIAGMSSAVHGGVPSLHTPLPDVRMSIHLADPLSPDVAPQLASRNRPSSGVVISEPLVFSTCATIVLTPLACTEVSIR